MIGSLHSRSTARRAERCPPTGRRLRGSRRGSWSGGPAALLVDDDLIVALQPGGRGEAAAGAVAGEAGVDPGALSGAGDDVADRGRLQAVLQDGVPAVVQAAPGVAVGVGEAGGLLPCLLGAGGADRGPGAVGDDAGSDLGHAEVGLGRVSSRDQWVVRVRSLIQIIEARRWRPAR